MRVGINQGLHSDALVRTLASHPTQPERLFAGTDKGLYTSSDAGQSWKLLDSPLSDFVVWALAFDPADPDTMFAEPEHPTPPRCSVPGTPVKVGNAVNGSRR